MDTEERQQLLEEPHQRPATSDEAFSSAAALSIASDNDLTNTPGERLADHGPLRTPRSLTLLNGFALVVGLQIGSGIFSAPSVVISKLPSPITAIFTWFSAGVLVWAGASSFIELGTRVPHNGGMQEYLRYCYGDLYGFLFAWVWLLVSRPCGMAMVALVFSEYLFRGILPDQEVSTWTLKAVALLAIILISFLNCMGTKVGTSSANIFLVLKTLGLGSIIVIGLVFQVTDPKHQDENHHLNGTEQRWSTTSSPEVTDTGYFPLWMSLGDFTDALFAALFAYAGWEAVSDERFM
jgi:L-type amino acid transporter 6